MFTEPKERIPLYAAAKCGSVSIIRYFISRGIDVNFQDEHDNTMLHTAVASCNLEVVEYLIDKVLTLILEANTMKLRFTVLQGRLT